MLLRESVNTKHIAHGFIKSKILCYNIFDKTLSLFLSLSLCETLSNQLYLIISYLFHVFQDSCISGSTFFRIQVFLGPDFSESRFSGSRFFRVQVFQGPDQGFRSTLFSPKGAYVKMQLKDEPILQNGQRPFQLRSNVYNDIDVEICGFLKNTKI